MTPLSGSELEFVRWLWQCRTEGDWPLASDALNRVDDSGLDYETICKATGAQENTDASGNPRVSVRTPQLLQLAEVKRLLEPLPRLIHLAINRLSLYPSFTDEHDPRTPVPYSEIRALWKSLDDNNMRLVAEVLFRSDLGSIYANGTKDEFVVYQDVHTLKYRHCSSLPDLLDTQASWTPRPTELTSNHALFLNAVFDHLCTTSDWPNASLFALAWADDYVPDLMEHLHPRFVVEQFGASSRSKIELRLWSLTVVDPSGSWKAKTVALVGAMARLLRRNGGKPPLLGESAAEAGLSLDDAKIAVRLLGSEPWARGLEWATANAAEWRLGATDKLRRFRDCVTWDDYLAKRREVFPPDGQSDQFGETGPLHRPQFLMMSAPPGALTDADAADTSDSPDSSDPTGSRSADAPKPTAASGLDSLIKRLAEGAAFSAGLTEMLLRDAREIDLCLANDAHKASLILCGSVLEGVLVGLLNMNPTLADAAFKRERRQQHKSFPADASLPDLLSIATSPNLVAGQSPLLSNVHEVLGGLVNRHRNLVHPHAEMRDEQLPITSLSAQIVANSLSAVLGQLARKVAEGWLSSYLAA